MSQSTMENDKNPEKAVMIYACSGGSNTGQIANDAAKQLEREGVGKMGCTMGLWTKLVSRSVFPIYYSAITLPV